MRAHNHAAVTPIRTVLTPGLGTAVGRLHPAARTRQMAAAYRYAHLGLEPSPADLLEACRRQFDLLRRD